MIDIKQVVYEAVCVAVRTIASSKDIAVTDSDLCVIVPSLPPSSDMGDLAFPMFPLARLFRASPAAIASEVAQQLGDADDLWVDSAAAAGPYVNVRLNRIPYFELIAEHLQRDPKAFVRTARYEGTKIMVEFSCPNTNKPLHLGHLRNNALGSAVSRLFSAAGAEVQRVNLINDRGVHICKSMLAYQKFGNGETPESSGKKSDHLVGDYYVKYAQWAKEDPTAEKQAAEMLRQWEAGDSDVIRLWKLMNGWAIGGVNETYRKTNIAFDKVYYESETYLSGKTVIMEGLKQGIFYTSEDGAVMVDLGDIGLDTKVLIRSDGTSLYLTQDIGTAIARHKDWPFESMVYVVGSEQQYHFTVLFHVLDKLGYTWARRLHHLSYGMVNLPDGKMKSREGTVVDADDLIDQLEEMALAEITQRNKGEVSDDAAETAHSIALAALNYYLLNVSPNKDMVFNPAESLSFTGDTGPYLQYVGARISSIMRKANFTAAAVKNVDYSLLQLESEWDLMKAVGRFPEVVGRAADTCAPSEVAAYLYDLGKGFSRYYHDTSVFQGVDENTASARLALCWFILTVMQQGFDLLGIPFLSRM